MSPTTRTGNTLCGPGEALFSSRSVSRNSLLPWKSFHRTPGRFYPYPHHGKAYFLFQLGRYEERWQEWRAAQICYERKLKGELRGAEKLRMAVDYADVLGDVFKDYKASERFYERVLERRADNTDACAGLAILYQQWANSDAATPEIHARLNYQVPRAIE